MPSAREVMAEATSHLAGGQYPQALSLLEPLIADAQVGLEAEYLLACGHYYSGAAHAAEAHFLAVLRRGHQSANSAYFLAELALRRQDRGLAICFLSGALTFDATHQAARVRMGELGISISSPPRATPAPGAAPTTTTAPQHPPRPPRWSGSRVGVVTESRQLAVPTMAGPATAQRLDVELVEYDKAGRAVGQSYVYLLGIKVTGHVGKGHWVEIAEKPADDGRVRKLTNLTTGTDVKSKSSPLFFPGS